MRRPPRDHSPRPLRQTDEPILTGAFLLTLRGMGVPDHRVDELAAAHKMDTSMTPAEVIAGINNIVIDGHKPFTITVDGARVNFACNPTPFHEGIATLGAVVMTALHDLRGEPPVTADDNGRPLTLKELWLTGGHTEIRRLAATVKIDAHRDREP